MSWRGRDPSPTVMFERSYAARIGWYCDLAEGLSSPRQDQFHQQARSERPSCGVDGGLAVTKPIAAPWHVNCVTEAFLFCATYRAFFGGMKPEGISSVPSGARADSRNVA